VHEPPHARSAASGDHIARSLDVHRAHLDLRGAVAVERRDVDDRLGAVDRAGERRGVTDVGPFGPHLMTSGLERPHKMTGDEPAAAAGDEDAHSRDSRA
jgi:hypothetical protein